MATYVLVHGGWSGGHTFRRVRPLLQAAGHAVFTPTLTGVGDRVHLGSGLVNLSTHVRDVVNLVLYEDLSGIVLLGYSYGGAVVTGAVQHIGDRIGHLVYLDAFVPGDGDTVSGLAGRPPTGRISLGEPWLVPPPERGYEDPEEAAFATVRRTPHPAACFTEPVRLTRPLEEHGFGLTYVRATADAADAPGAAAFERAAAHARASAAWRYREIATTHMIPSNRPAELAGLLLELE